MTENRPDAQRRRAVSADDLMRLRIATSPQLSPDGRRVALCIQSADAAKNAYWSHLWVVETESGRRRQFSFGEVSDAGPQWSPDGQWIAFVRKQQKESQVWLLHSEGGEALPLTALPPGNIGGLCWSPDGQRLAMQYRPTDEPWTKEAKERREQEHRSAPPRVVTRLHYRLDGFGYFGDSRQHVWVCDVAGALSQDGGSEPVQCRQITGGDYDDTSPVWLGGERLAFISNRCDDPDGRPYEESIWVVSAGGGRIEALAVPRGYKSSLSCAPDGKHVAFFMEEGEHDPWIPRNAQLWVVPLGGGEARSLSAPLDRTAGNATLSDVREAFTGAAPPVWSSDGSRLFFLVSSAGSTHVYSVGLDDAAPVPCTHGALDVSAMHGRAGILALIAAAPVEPPAVRVLSQQKGAAPAASNPRDSAPPVLWNPNAALLEEIAAGAPEELHVDGGDHRIQTWLLHPPDFDPQRKYPLLLYIHGGPHAQYGNTFFHEFQFLAAQGYVVLYSNPRGSMGYAESFAAAIRGNWGQADYKDLMAVVDHACALPYVDTDRLAVAGGSYGGYMTNWIVGHTDRFRCAITDRSVVNLHSMAGTCDFPETPDGYWAGNAWDRPEELWRQSPLKYSANCTTPLLIIHSEGDLRCPISQAEELYSALKRQKREVVFVRYPSESSHGMSRSGPPDLRLDRLERIVGWLDRFLK